MATDKLEELKNKFLEYLEVEKGRSPYSVRNYDFYLKRFLEITKIDSPAEITPPLTSRYIMALARLTDSRNRPLKKVTINYHLIALRAFLRYLIRHQALKVMSPDNIELLKADEAKVKVLDEASLEKLLQIPDLHTRQGLRDRAILELLFSSGLRVAELVSLNASEINFKSSEISVLGKGKRVRVVFISKKAEWALKAYFARRADEYKPLFIRFKGGPANDQKGEGLRLSTRSVQKLVHLYARKAGLAIEPSPHTLRHTFATDLIRSGADLRSVQEMLGHKNVATTQRYIHVTNPQLREVHRKYHSGNKEEGAEPLVP
ncbi:MAG: tyrosine-type recombinase/integrase [Patescibacteria group bacterium]